MRIGRISILGKAFTFVELMIVVVIVGIITALVLPQFGGDTEDSRVAAAQSALGGVRSGIAGYRARQLISGAPPYPSAEAIATPGSVIQGPMPANPWNQSARVQSVSREQAAAREVVAPEEFGWNYYMDNSTTPPVAIFYANTARTTEVTDSEGRPKRASEL